MVSHLQNARNRREEVFTILYRIRSELSQRINGIENKSFTMSEAYYQGLRDGFDSALSLVNRIDEEHANHAREEIERLSLP